MARRPGSNLIPRLAGQHMRPSLLTALNLIKYLSMSDRAVVTAIGEIGEVADPPTDDEFPHANQVKLWVFHELRSTQAVSVARQK